LQPCPYLHKAMMRCQGRVEVSSGGRMQAIPHYQPHLHSHLQNNLDGL